MVGSYLLIEFGDIACIRKVDVVLLFFCQRRVKARLFQKERLIDSDPLEEELWRHISGQDQWKESFFEVQKHSVGQFLRLYGDVCRCLVFRGISGRGVTRKPEEALLGGNMSLHEEDYIEVDQSCSS